MTRFRGLKDVLQYPCLVAALPPYYQFLAYVKGHDGDISVIPTRRVRDSVQATLG